jgi:tRNA uracil 4-sulfurtransferase
MRWDGVLVRFGEIGIKSTPVRRHMLDRLQQNLLAAMLREGVEGNVERRGPRLWMQGPDADALAEVACRTFGVVSASPCRIVASSMEAMGEAAAQSALEVPWQSFAIRAEREGEHPYTSQDVGIQVGSAVYRAAEAAGRSPRVDLGKPDLELHIDIRGERAYIFHEKRAGPGGLPVGTQGRIVALVSNSDSLLAAWLLMRRGCNVTPVHAGSNPPDLDALCAWGLTADLRVAPRVPDRAALLQLAQDVAAQCRADAVCTGEGMRADLLVPPGMTVLRPLAGLDVEERERWRQVAGL